MSFVLEKEEVIVAAHHSEHEVRTRFVEVVGYLFHKDSVVLYFKVMLQLLGKVQGHIYGKSLPAGVIYLSGVRETHFKPTQGSYCQRLTNIEGENDVISRSKVALYL